MFREIKSLGPVDFKQMVYQEMAQLLCCFIPIFKIRVGRYLIGSHVQTLEVNEDNEVMLVERVISLEDYLVNFAIIECLRLDKIMNQAKLSFKGVIELLLKKYQANPHNAATFISEIP